ncbi:hypothetical protein BJ996_007218 [Streptomyces phaeogriseichromatogenes]|nr:hypothetical protein [Streptomyces murinus]
MTERAVDAKAVGKRGQQDALTCDSWWAELGIDVFREPWFSFDDRWIDPWIFRFPSLEFLCFLIGSVLSEGGCDVAVGADPENVHNLIVR